MIEINPVLARVLLVVFMILKIRCHHNPSESTRRYTNKRKEVPKATPKIVAPKINQFPAKTITEHDIDLCLDTTPDSDPSTVPNSMPSIVPTTAATPSPVSIRESRKIDQLYQLRERNKNNELYQLQERRKNNQLCQLEDPLSSDATTPGSVSTDTDSDNDSISGANNDTPPPISIIANVFIIRKPIFSPEPFDLPKFTTQFF